MLDAPLQHSRPSLLAARRRILLGGAALVVVGSAGRPARAKTWSNFWGLALRGYDPVAYFDEGRPVEGASEHAFEWDGAEWRFATAERRARFIADPAAYAPQYGGHCAYAAARNYLASSVPEAWDLVDGKLYMNYSLSIRDKWRNDVPGNIARGDTNWPGLSAA